MGGKITKYEKIEEEIMEEGRRNHEKRKRSSKSGPMVNKYEQRLTMNEKSEKKRNRPG